MVELNLDEFGIRIAELRELSGKSQEEVSENLGITQQTLSRYEKGQRQASLDFVVKSAQYFNVSTDYLLGFSKVKSAEEDVKCICRITGLSEKAVIDLNCFKDVPSSKQKSFYKNLYDIIKYSEFGIYDINDIEKNYLNNEEKLNNYNINEFLEISKEAAHLFYSCSDKSKKNFSYIQHEIEKTMEDIKRMNKLFDELIKTTDNITIREIKSNPEAQLELVNKASLIIEKIKRESEQDADNNPEEE